jgi:hypothetical protein
MAKRPSLLTMTRPKPAESTRAQPAAAAPRGEEGREADHAMTLRLPKSMVRDLKLRSIDEERPVSEIVRDAIKRYIRAVGGAAAH